MGYKTKRFGATKVELGDGYWAEIRHLSYGETQSFQSAFRDDAERSAAGEESLVRMIVRWNLDDDDGGILPISRESMRELTLADYSSLAQAAGRLVNPVAALDGPARAD